MVLRHPIVATVLALLFTLAPASDSGAEEWLADRDIGSFCQQYLTRPDSPSGTVCLSYIQGFLDGLRTTETPKRDVLYYENRSEEDMQEAERVSAVRLNALVEEFGPPARAGICLPKEFTADEVARVIARGVRHGSSSSRGALDDYAQAALQERYPCDTSDPAEQDNTEGSVQ